VPPPPEAVPPPPEAVPPPPEAVPPPPEAAPPPPRLVDYERFNKIAGGVQSIVLSIAVVVGGGWALYQFHALQQVERARLDIEELRSKQPVLNIDLSASTLLSPPTRENGGLQPEASYLQVIMTIQNVGKSDTYLDLRNQPLKIFHIDLDGARNEVEVDRQWNLLLCRAGSTFKSPFLARIKDSGLYYIRLEIPVEPGDAERHYSDPGYLVYKQKVEKDLKEHREQYEKLFGPRMSVSPTTTSPAATSDDLWVEDIYYVAAKAR
jgi:hypothetical protein